MTKVTEETARWWSEVHGLDPEEIIYPEDFPHIKEDFKPDQMKSWKCSQISAQNLFDFLDIYMKQRASDEKSLTG